MRLWVEPEDIEDLRIQFDAATSDEDLDKRLESFGLTIIDGDGDYDCLDFRSLFLDQLEGSVPGRRWGKLPLSSVKTDAVDKPGVVLSFLSEIHAHGANVWDAAAGVVRDNVDQDRPKRSIEEFRSASIRLCGLLFAHIEDAVGGGGGDRMRIKELIGVPRPGKAHPQNTDDEEDSRDASTEFFRIIKKAGYKSHVIVLRSLKEGPLAAPLARAAQWYLEKHHPSLAQANWPPQCSMKD